MATHNIQKSKITKVGYINKEGYPAGFSFCCKGIENSVGYFKDLKNGVELYGGYTIEELKGMCK